MLMSAGCVEDLIIQLSQEARELYLDSEIPRVSRSELSPLSFYRDYVSRNRPVIITEGLNHFPALKLWTNEYLRKEIGETLVSIAVTPNGYADAVTDGLFMLPEERSMKFNAFLDIMEGHTKDKGIFYVQKQNSNFTEEFHKLHGDASLHVDWASEAFGKSPDATNFWMGDERAITSMHKDHYENIYCVIRGVKTFTLLPPTDAAFVPYDFHSVGTYKQEGQDFIVETSQEYTEKVPWIEVDPTKPDLTAHPEFAAARPVQVCVKEGEMLYLPSLWFHHVTQTQGCIAVNYWYDMEFDIRYNYFKLLEGLGSMLHKKSQSVEGGDKTISDKNQSAVLASQK